MSKDIDIPQVPSNSNAIPVETRKDNQIAILRMALQAVVLSRGSYGGTSGDGHARCIELADQALEDIRRLETQ